MSGGPSTNAFIETQEGKYHGVICLSSEKDIVSYIVEINVREISIFVSWIQRASHLSLLIKV
jgi:hypothetical protein